MMTTDVRKRREEATAGAADSRARREERLKAAYAHNHVPVYRRLHRAVAG